MLTLRFPLLLGLRIEIWLPGLPILLLRLSGFETQLLSVTCTANHVRTISLGGRLRFGKSTHSVANPVVDRQTERRESPPAVH